MSPQFVDFNADQHLDIVAGTFDGSPHVAFGTSDGFEQPVPILDKEGARILLNQFWNDDEDKWDETDRCDPEGGPPAKGHGTSAWATDWDGDGDLDLLLGDYDGGYVYLRLNEGTSGEPEFATRNVLVRAAGGPASVGKVATPRMIDCTGDGLPDLVLGCMGDSFGDGPGGAVFVYPALAGGKTVQFGARMTLIPPSAKGARGPTRPDAGLYMDLADHDADGDLDLVVGGYSMWTPDAPALTPEQEALVAKLRAEKDEVMARSRKLNEELYRGLEELEGEALKKARDLRLEAQKEQRAEVGKRLRAITSQLAPLSPGKQRQSFVWLYENLAAGASPGAPGNR